MSLADQTYTVVVAPFDGSAIGRVIGPPGSVGPNGSYSVTMSFVPDGSAVIARYGSDDNGTEWWLPVDDSAGTLLGTGALQFLDVQRLPN